MLNECHIKELKAIAFNVEESPADIVDACATLAKHCIDVDKVVCILNAISADSTVKSKVRIKAINLIDKIVTEESVNKARDIVDSKEQETEIEKELMKEYGLG